MVGLSLLYALEGSSMACFVPGTTPQVFPRVEIATLIQDEFQFSLFIQAMSRLQTQGYKPEPASWQEIGG